MDHPSRRTVLAGGAAFAAWGAIPRAAAAPGSKDPRFLTIVLRGGLDGLAAVAPIGDPAYAAIRDEFALPESGAFASVPLSADFALNGNMPNLADLYRRGEALFVHAAHTAYRERSHFAAQDVLENGVETPLYFESGWLGRAISEMPVESRIARRDAFAAAASVPLTLRGAGHVVTWLPAGLPAASIDTRDRLLALYEHTDRVLADAMLDGIALEHLAGSEREIREGVRQTMMMMGGNDGPSRKIVAAAAAAGRAMAADDGARVGFLDFHGFDTHRSQHNNRRLGKTLERLDQAIAALRQALGPVWGQTVVTITTEFGRTVRINGSDGTDHGAGTVAMVLGGTVNGGRVIADWPGLAERQLYEGRDLRPTTDLRAVLKGILADHFGLDRRTLGDRVFPRTAALSPIEGLIK
ncbi:MAG: DUF1501 domain-containing protein [Pseudomonadota bacterium]